MEIDVFVQYIMTILPSVVSIISGLGTIGVVVSRIRNSSKRTEISLNASLNDLSKDNMELKRSLNEVIAENAMLKKQLNKVMVRMEQNEKQTHQKTKD